MQNFIADVTDFNAAAAVTTAVSAAFSSSTAIVKSVGGAIVGCILGWFLVHGWTRLWNTELRSGAFTAYRAMAALCVGLGAFFLIASFQGEDYLAQMESRMELAVGGNAEWKRNSFEDLRSQLGTTSAGAGGTGANDTITLRNRSDLVLVAEEIWEAAFAAANRASELPFRLDILKSPGPNVDGAPPVFPVELSEENDWTSDAERSVMSFWKNQAEEWISSQLEGLRPPVALLCLAVVAVAFAGSATIAWKDIKA